MKLIKKVALISLLTFYFLGANNLVKAGGDVDKIEGFGPYIKYERCDNFTNFIFSEVPDDLVPQVREWIKTEEGKKQGFYKENGGRNNEWGKYECLGDKVYEVLGEHYDIPKNLRPYYVISKSHGKPYDVYFDSLMPEGLKSQANSILPRIRAEFHAEEKKITDWMTKCDKANRIFPFESTTCTIL